MAVPNDELNRALDIWLYIEATQPAWAADYVKRRGNPFDPWPPEEKTRIDEFLRVVNQSLFHEAPPENLSATIDPKKREELVGEFDREYQKVKAAHTKAELEAKKKVQEVIRHTLEDSTTDPKQKELLFKETIIQMADDPAASVSQAQSKAVTILERAQPFLNEKSFERETPSFSKLESLGAIQKGIAAPILDAAGAVFPELRQGALNKNLEAAFERVVGIPGQVPGKLIEFFGQKTVESPLFKQMLQNVQMGVTQRRAPGGARSVFDDIASSLFKKSFDTTAQQSVATYWELYRIQVAQGLPPPNANQFMAAGMGLGSTALNIGKGYVISKARGAAVKGLLARLGLEAAIPGAGWVVAAFELANSLFGKAVGWLKSLTGVKPGEVPGDRWIIGIGCGAILLVFFVLPFTQQFNIDSSLVTRFAGGPGAPGPGGTGPSFPTYPDAPAIPSEITGCPTKSAYQLTQCIAGDYSHGALCAYDIGIPMGQPIVAAHDGVVSHVIKESSSGGYGNMVEIKGVTPSGQTYYTLYGHLMRFNVSVGQQVRAGDVIGLADDTGNSSGSHLHFEYRGASNNALPNCGIQFLPSACVTNPGYCNLR